MFWTFIPKFHHFDHDQILLFLLLAEQHRHQSVCFQGLRNSSMFDSFDKLYGHVYVFVKSINIINNSTPFSHPSPTHPHLLHPKLHQLHPLPTIRCLDDHKELRCAWPHNVSKNPSASHVSKLSSIVNHVHYLDWGMREETSLGIPVGARGAFQMATSSVSIYMTCLGKQKIMMRNLINLHQFVVY